MAILVREASLMAALVLLATANPALSEKGGKPKDRVERSAGQDAAHGNTDGDSKGGGAGDAKGTPAPAAGLGILALAALVYGMRRLQASKEK